MRRVHDTHNVLDQQRVLCDALHRQEEERRQTQLATLLGLFALFKVRPHKLVARGDLGELTHGPLLVAAVVGIDLEGLDLRESSSIQYSKHETKAIRVSKRRRKCC